MTMMMVPLRRFFVFIIILLLAKNVNIIAEKINVSEPVCKSTYVLCLVDGWLYGVDASSGQLKWSLNSGGSLVHRRNSKITEKNGQHFEFIPATDGSLFAYTSAETGLEAMPYNVWQIVESSPAVAPDGAVLLGSKKHRHFSLDAESGEVLLENDDDVNKTPSTSRRLNDDLLRSHILDVIRSDYEVTSTKRSMNMVKKRESTAIQRVDDMDGFNVTVSRYSLYLHSPVGTYSSDVDVDVEIKDDRGCGYVVLKSNFIDRVYGVHPQNGMILWEHPISSTPVEAYAIDTSHAPDVKRMKIELKDNDTKSTSSSGVYYHISDYDGTMFAQIIQSPPDTTPAHLLDEYDDEDMDDGYVDTRRKVAQNGIPSLLPIVSTTAGTCDVMSHDFPMCLSGRYEFYKGSSRRQSPPRRMIDTSKNDNKKRRNNNDEWLDDDYDEYDDEAYPRDPPKSPSEATTTTTTTTTPSPSSLSLSEKTIHVNRNEDHDEFDDDDYDDDDDEEEEDDDDDDYYMNGRMPMVVVVPDIVADHLFAWCFVVLIIVYCVVRRIRKNAIASVRSPIVATTTTTVPQTIEPIQMPEAATPINMNNNNNNNVDITTNSNNDENIDDSNIKTPLNRKPSVIIDTPTPLAVPSIPISRYSHDFNEIRKLGRGGFGTVYLAKSSFDQQEYAIKKIRLYEGHSSTHDLVMREVVSIAKLDHVNVVRYYQSWKEEVDQHVIEDDDDDDDEGLVSESDVSSSMNNTGTSSVSFSLNDPIFDKWNQSNPLYNNNQSNTSKSIPFSFTKGESSIDDDDDDDNKNDISLADAAVNEANSPIDERGQAMVIYIQMQFCARGTLDAWIRNPDRIVDYDHVRDMFRQIVSGLRHIHSQGLVHRDLKPTNIFMSEDLRPKIGDFGLSKPVEDAVSRATHAHFIHNNSNKKARNTTGVGSPLYCSPEQLAGKTYTEKVDIFSLGIIFCEMWHQMETQMERYTILRDARNGKLDGVPERWREFCKSMLKFDPTQRPSANEILEDDFFSSKTE